MSLFATGFWIPSSVKFGTTFLDTGANWFDSFAAVLVSTVFSGIQLCMCRRIIQLHNRLRQTTSTGTTRGSSKKSKFGREDVHGILLIMSCVLFAALFISSALVYSVQFSRNILALRSIRNSATTSAAAQVVRACPQTLGGGGVGGALCLFVRLEDLMQGRRMELAYAALVQGLIFVTDSLLVFRCYIIFGDKPFVWVTALVSLLASVGVSLFGLIALMNAGGLSGGDSWNWPASINPRVDTPLPPGFSPSMSIISSLFVNAIVSVCIIARMLSAHRRTRSNGFSLATHSQNGRPLTAYSQSGGGARVSTAVSTPRAIMSDDVYSTAAALMAESALPPVLFGVLASVFASPAVMQSNALLFEFNLFPKVVWVAVTALAPQLILVRILQGRAWSRNGPAAASSTGANSTGVFTRSQGSVTPIAFARPAGAITGEKPRRASVDSSFFGR